MVVLCFSHYGESIDVTFLIVVYILTKLLVIKVNQVSDPETYLYTEMGVRLITGVYHVKTRH